MSCAKIMIPKVSNNYKLYVYRSKSAEDINTISKVKALDPIIIIDEAIAPIHNINGGSYYVTYDMPTSPHAGITYIGPVANIIPTTEYETSIDIVKINNYTYVNKLLFKPLPIKYNGTVVYYSVIGVDEVNNTITHLSKVNGLLIECPYEKEGTRHLYSCDNFEDTKDDVWNYVGSIPWDKDAAIGDIDDQSAIDQYGYPFLNSVRIFNADDVNVSLRPLLSRNFVVLEIPNTWQRNNKVYNYRKLKSYKLQNVYDGQYSNFSEPTHQSLLPVSIEKMIILKKEDPENPDTIITINESENTDVTMYQIIRKDGIYYNRKDHRKLGLNKYNIPIEEQTAIFSEASVQDQIKIQVEARPNHIYSFTIYILDVYKNVSYPVHFIVNT